MAHPYWPIFDLEVRTPRLTLRPLTDELLIDLAALAERGVHDPKSTPFTTAWTDLSRPELQRGMFQYHWRCRADLSPATWTIGFAVFADDVIVGSTDLSAVNFSARRTVTTGSWLGREYQGIGLGKEFRLAILTLAFDGFGAEVAATEAFHDNAASIGVTRSLGYQDNGEDRLMRRDLADTVLKFRMEKNSFDEIRRDDITLHGVGPVADMLGLA